MAESPKKTVTLFTGAEMPLSGLGTWKMGQDEAADIVHKAINLGYRAIDGACDYDNEKQVGEGIRRALDAGTVTRDQLFVTSKLWNTYHHREHVRPALERSLSDFGLDYFDLYLIHFPICLKYVPIEDRYPPEWIYDYAAPEGPKSEFDLVSIRETWQALEECVDAGLVKHIGVANFSPQMLLEVLSFARIKPAVNQVEMHPYLQQQSMIRVCKAHGVVVTGYSSFGPLSYIPLNDNHKKIPSLLTDVPVLQALAEKYSATPAQVILRWQTQQDVVVIPKSANEQRLHQNLEHFHFTLSQEDLDEIAKITFKRRFNDPGEYLNYPIFD